uniref:Uncharacterized protein isoform X1 n=1 Tax=Nicotiana tabacum TaxID=4097 RepID=A0A1S3YF82_TOBAC|nr:PREDICTED: uncharacterized protein LOC107775668 isoform X1 [Nicotiana tabacum]
MDLERFLELWPLTTLILVFVLIPFNDGMHFLPGFLCECASLSKYRRQYKILSIVCLGHNVLFFSKFHGNWTSAVENRFTVCCSLQSSSNRCDQYFRVLPNGLLVNGAPSLPLKQSSFSTICYLIDANMHLGYCFLS